MRIGMTEISRVCATELSVNEFFACHDVVCVYRLNRHKTSTGLPSPHLLASLTMMLCQFSNTAAGGCRECHSSVTFCDIDPGCWIDVPASIFIQISVLDSG
jgi:hypothetical protein